MHVTGARTPAHLSGSRASGGHSVPSAARAAQAVALDNFVRAMHHLAFAGQDKKL